MKDVASLLREFAKTTPEDVTVLSGAGISVEGPSSLPTGWELTKRVFDAYFLPDTLARMLRHHRAVGWLEVPSCAANKASGDPRPPRLETVLGVVARIYGEHSVDEIVADVATASPNRLHDFLGRHLAAGGGHLTANFDECIETAAAASGSGWRTSDLLHFHGAVGGKLGATLTRIEKGFSPALAAEFTDLLTARPFLIVVGYSGSDFFDVNASVMALPPDALRGIQVVWLQHNAPHKPHLTPIIDNTDDPVPPLPIAMRRKGAAISVLCGPTDFLVRKLGDQWGFPLGVPAGRRPSPPAVSVDDDLREVASLALFLDSGLFDEVELLLTPMPKAPPGLIRSAAGAALWEAGRWNDLRRRWSGVRPRSGVTRIERIGATMWVQGRFLPALAWLMWHRKRAGGDDRRELAETEGRVIEHMSRVPGLKWLAAKLAADVLQEIGTTDQTAGVHQFRRRTDLASSLAGRRGDQHAAISSEWFGQAGNILAWISYRHRMLRDRYRHDDSTSDLVRDYRELQRLYKAVGSRSGAMRTHLLPGAHRVFSLGEVVGGVRSLQYGWCQRARIVALHLMRHIADRQGR
ncbi:hypothetical protein ACSHWB_21860 [Lentzea sp. HUAS TT2]|uniref:hypothetical protein n=1 Tax=Lentzea sp. HUAS TT2 TaxID=3447454 RepID=UPI003F6FE0DB